MFWANLKTTWAGPAGGVAKILWKQAELLLDLESHGIITTTKCDNHLELLGRVTHFNPFHPFPRNNGKTMNCLISNKMEISSMWNQKPDEDCTQIVSCELFQKCVCDGVLTLKHSSLSCRCCSARYTFAKQIYSMSFNLQDHFLCPWKNRDPRSNHEMTWNDCMLPPENGPYPELWIESPVMNTEEIWYFDSTCSIQQNPTEAATGWCPPIMFVGL